MWQNSLCKAPGWLHRWVTLRTFPNGIQEACTRCPTIMFFRNDVPNSVYLSYHLRLALQKDNPRFKYEYL